MELALKITYANSKTYTVQPRERKTATGTELDDKLAVFPLPSHKLWKAIKMLEYNCVSNSGKDFISKEDHQLLRNIKDMLTWSMVTLWKLGPKNELTRFRECKFSGYRYYMPVIESGLRPISQKLVFRLFPVTCNMS